MVEVKFKKMAKDAEKPFNRAFKQIKSSVRESIGEPDSEHIPSKVTPDKKLLKEAFTL